MTCLDVLDHYGSAVEYSVSDYHSGSRGRRLRILSWETGFQTGGFEEVVAGVDDVE